MSALRFDRWGNRGGVIDAVSARRARFRGRAAFVNVAAQAEKRTFIISQQCRRLWRRPLPGDRRELRHCGRHRLLPSRATTCRRRRSARSIATRSPVPCRRPTAPSRVTNSSPSSACADALSAPPFGMPARAASRACSCASRTRRTHRRCASRYLRPCSQLARSGRQRTGPLGARDGDTMTNPGPVRDAPPRGRLRASRGAPAQA